MIITWLYSHIINYSLLAGIGIIFSGGTDRRYILLFQAIGALIKKNHQGGADRKRFATCKYRLRRARLLNATFDFGTEFTSPIIRFGDIPPQPDNPPLADAHKNLVIHAELPILDGRVPMGTDAPESMGFTVISGNNAYINHEPDSRSETDRPFTALSEGGEVQMPLQEMFWGGYYGSLVDRFGIHWMFNCASDT